MADLPQINDAEKKCIAKSALERYGLLSISVCTWLIAYGVSLAALFITQTAAFAHFSARMRWFAILPAFIGVGLQLFLVLSIKYCNLITYKAHDPAESLEYDSNVHKAARWWAETFWIDIIIDVLTVMSYAISTAVIAYGLSMPSAAETDSTIYQKGNQANEHQTKEDDQEEDDQEEDDQEEGRQEEGRQEEGRQEEGRQEEVGQEEVGQSISEAK